MIKVIHITLAFLSVAGFVIRAGWSYTAPDLLQQKWVKIAPHVVDTLLLTLGLAMALALPEGLFAGWLTAKLLALLCYIGFGVLTLRGSGWIKHLGVLGALTSVSYIFLVAFTRQVWPF